MRIGALPMKRFTQGTGAMMTLFTEDVICAVTLRPVVSCNVLVSSIANNLVLDIEAVLTLLL